MRSSRCEEMRFEVGLNVKQTMGIVNEKHRDAGFQSARPGVGRFALIAL